MVLQNKAQKVADKLNEEAVASTLSPESPIILRILVLLEKSNKLLRLSFKVLSPQPVKSMISISCMRFE
jgi:hypothetical protein